MSSLKITGGPIGKTTPVDQFNKKVKNEACKITDLPGSQVYCTRWVCKHYGTDKQEKTTSGENRNTKSRNRSHLTKGCQFFLYMAWNKLELCYQVKSCQLSHSHDIGPGPFQLYATNRYTLIVHLYCNSSSYQ